MIVSDKDSKDKAYDNYEEAKNERDFKFLGIAILEVKINGKVYYIPSYD